MDHTKITDQQHELCMHDKMLPNGSLSSSKSSFMISFGFTTKHFFLSAVHTDNVLQSPSPCFLQPHDSPRIPDHPYCATDDKMLPNSSLLHSKYISLLFFFC